MFVNVRQWKSQQGMSMVEVLVTVVIVTFGLLGVAGLLATGLRHNQSSQWRTQATVLAYDMAEMMRSNRATALTNEYVTATTAANAVAVADKAQWATDVAAALPSGVGTVTKTGTNFFTVTIQWNDSKAGGGATEQFVFRGEL